MVPTGGRPLWCFRSYRPHPPGASPTKMGSAPTGGSLLARKPLRPLRGTKSRKASKVSSVGSGGDLSCTLGTKLSQCLFECVLGVTPACPGTASRLSPFRQDTSTTLVEEGEWTPVGDKVQVYSGAQMRSLGSSEMSICHCCLGPWPLPI